MVGTTPLREGNGYGSARGEGKLTEQESLTGGRSDADGWVRYQGDSSKGSKAAWLPITIGVATGVLAYPMILPYMLMLLDNIRRQNFNPHYLGIPVLDAFLGILVPFFQDVFASADYGRFVVSYFSAVILSWALAAGVEASRRDSKRNKLISVFSPFVSLEVVSGVGIITPVIWVAPFLRMPGNADSVAQLTPTTVAGKRVSAERVRWVSIVILTSFVPYVAGYLLNDWKYHVNQLLVLVLPLFWPLFWGPAPSGDMGSPVEGHLTALRVHDVGVGIGLLQHVLAVSHFLEHPDTVPRMLEMFHDIPMTSRPTLFVLVTTISLVAALLVIPLTQEGFNTALGVLVKSFLVGPAAALSLYFGEREKAYLEVASKSAGKLA